MNERLRIRIEELFENAPRTRRVNDLKEELLSNLNDRYNDSLTAGKTESEAFNNAISGIGDVDELLRGIKETDVFDYNQIQKERQKTAMIMTISVGLYIMSVVILILMNEIFRIDSTLSVCFMLTIDAAATCLIIYHFLSRPKYIKEDDTMVEEFKEWKSNNSQKNSILRSIKSIIWTIIVALYLLLSFVFGIWAYSWIIFIIGAAIERIVTLMFQLRE